MDFSITDEKQLIVETAQRFTETELMPYEEEVEHAGAVRPELVQQIKDRSLAAGIYAANMPADVGGVDSTHSP